MGNSGVVYGFQMESTAIMLDARAFAKMLATHGTKSVFQLEVEGKRINAVLTEVQRCALKGMLNMLILSPSICQRS